MVILAFVFPISITAVDVLLPVIILLWFSSENLKERLSSVIKEPISLLFVLIAFLTFISALLSTSWTDSFLAGAHRSLFEVLAMHYLLLPLLIPVFLTTVEDKFMKYMLVAFVLAMLYSQLLFYLVYFNFVDIEYLKSIHLVSSGASSVDPSPFLNRIEYSIFLAVSISFSIHYIIYNKSHLIRVLLLFFAMLSLLNLFINGGRTGQLVFVVSFFIYFVAYSRFNYRYLLMSTLTILLVVTIAYKYSTPFQGKVERAKKDIMLIVENHNYRSSWGARIASNMVATAYLTSSSERFIFGAGAGDSEKEYRKYAEENFSQNIYHAVNHLAHTHNQYLQYWLDGSILAFLLYLLYFYLLVLLDIGFQKPLLYAFASIVIVSTATDILMFRTHTALLFYLITGYFIRYSKKQKQNI